MMNKEHISDRYEMKMIISHREDEFNF